MKSTDQQEIDRTKNHHAEREIIGTIIQKEIFSDHITKIRADEFTSPFHQMVWRAIAHLVDREDPVTFQSVSAACGTGLNNQDREHLEQIIMRSSGTEGILLDAISAVKDATKRRNAAQIFQKARQRAIYSEDPIGTTVSRIAVEAENAINDSSSAFMDGVAANRKLREKLEKKLVPIPTGIKKLDHVLEGGLMPTRMLAIVAQTKQGKTTLASTISYNLLERKEPHLVISLERNETDIEQVCAARALKINTLDLEQNFENHAAQYDKYASSKNHRLRTYDHNPNATIEDIQASILKAHRAGAKGFILDYWQLIQRPPRESVSEHLSRCAQTLANLTSRLRMWSIVNAQSHADGIPRECQALWLASPSLYVIRRDGPDKPETWLQCLGSSYTKGLDAGGPGRPAMLLDTQIGPHFRSC
jgi:replicative DNA helicase